ncbi:iron hydrogenase [Epithele typhae]|uniref:iron hydrogenase n=1 Tax=Epithele typhae TaxID=378194 RepID=UPI0020073D33|nr:iron hydrogenase [Epithele typhae]KAH9940508.1 iron hydrogenase [Epithele typhae]
MAFSGALTLTDLNDFITPSQACIKPVEQSNKPESNDPGAATTQIQVDSSGSYYEVPSNPTTAAHPGEGKKKLTAAEISLNDCLACSGCITSAESVLITMQSHAEVLNFLENNPPPPSCHYRVPIISIAPQSLASLAASNVSLLQTLRRMSAFCRDILGFAHVYDTTFARHLSLLEHVREFQERKAGEGDCKLPMLASACPGGRTKSPQQIMGTLVKEWLGTKWGKTPDQIYHVTVMPCYDKKLEASRQDFYNEAYATRDVDCVITTGELQLLMLEKGWDLSTPTGAIQPRPGSFLAKDKEGALPELLAHPGSSSGSFLQALVRALIVAHPDPAALSLTTRAVRGSDYSEVTLTHTGTNEVLFRGATCYGFRNLQNVVRKVGRDAGVQVARGAAGRLAGRARGRAVKRGGAVGAPIQDNRGYDYVEVMACPSGCINGGGQLRPPPSAQGKDEEGLVRDWDADGVRVPSEPPLETDEPLPAPVTGVRWGDREWTKTVEAAYWRVLLTPLPTPPADGVPAGAGCAEAEADALAARVLVEATRAKGMGEIVGWDVRLDEEAEGRRTMMFRTQYRAVESEVIGLAVKW